MVSRHQYHVLRLLFYLAFVCVLCVCMCMCVCVCICVCVCVVIVIACWLRRRDRRPAQVSKSVEEEGSKTWPGDERPQATPWSTAGTKCWAGKETEKVRTLFFYILVLPLRMLFPCTRTCVLVQCMASWICPPNTIYYYLCCHVVVTWPFNWLLLLCTVQALLPDTYI